MLELIRPERFDLMAKYLYIKNYFNKNNSSFYIDLYKSHINTFNKAWEYPGTKTNIEEFISSFNKLIESIKKNGYDNKSIIEIDSNNIIINGAHRLMICYYLNIKPNIKIINKNNCNANHSYDFFLNRNNYWRRNNEIYENMSTIYMDTIALEYLKIKKNVRVMILYPVSYQLGKRDEIQEIIKNYGILYYKKLIKLNKNGVKNLIKELYRGETWIGGMFPNDNCGGKFDVCYSDDPIELYLIDFNEGVDIIKFKEECRKLFNIGKHSLHISDDNIDTFRIGSSLLNENSINFLNNGTNNLSDNTKQLLIEYFNKYNKDKCIISDIVKEMINTNIKADKLDYFYFNGFKFKLK